MSKILVTGAFGQIGSELVPALQAKFGLENVVAVGNKNIPTDFEGIVEQASLPDMDRLKALVEKHQIDTIYHLVSLLSAKGEVDPSYTWQLNMQSLKDVLDLARDKNIKVFWPSSIAAFGPTTPVDHTPQRTVLEPTTMYGVTKVAGELLCQYYWKKFGVDVRSVRYPGIISWKEEPGGGTSDYAVAIFYEALLQGKYESFVGPETTLPMMYMDDAVRATIELMEADGDKLTVRTSYNLAAFSFTMAELAVAVNKIVPVEVTYKPDHRQAIADSWPNSVDDSVARADWGWNHKFDVEKMCEVMVEQLRGKLLVNE